MTREDAFQVLIESFEAKCKLFNLVPKYIPNMKDYKERDDIDARLYKGVFTSFHVINERISVEIYKEFPDLKKEFENMMDEKCSKKKNEK